MAAEGVAVQEGRRPGGERLVDPVGYQHRAERGVPGGDALCTGDDVRLVAVALRAEHVPEPAERADDLVGDHQYVIPVADLPHPREVAGRRREAAAGVLYRLQEHRGDGVRPLHLDRRRDLVRGPATERDLVVCVFGRAVEVRVRHLVRARHEWFEHLLRAAGMPVIDNAPCGVPW